MLPHQRGIQKNITEFRLKVLRLLKEINKDIIINNIVIYYDTAKGSKKHIE